MPTADRSASGGAASAGHRHALIVRATHWLNLLCVAVLLPSGLQIFSAHPALYWGEASRFDRPLLAMIAEPRPGGAVGLTTLLDRRFETTGLLGLSRDAQGFPAARGFPAWATLPSYQDLATGRRWHFFFAWLFVLNGAVYVVAGLASGHVRRDLLPSRAPGGYNLAQRLAYLAVVFALLPLLIVAGLAMSPALDAALPWLPELFGGRQSARTVHFAAALLLVLFAAGHVLMLLLSRPLRRGWAMIAGG